MFNLRHHRLDRFLSIPDKARAKNYKQGIVMNAMAGL
jgi:hypothetical protein